MSSAARKVKIVEELHRNIQEYTGFRAPEQPMAKAFFCLTAALDRKKGDWLDHEITTKTEEDTGTLARVKHECVDDEYGGEYKEAPWKKRRHESGASACTDEVERPWRKDLKEQPIKRRSSNA